MVIRDDVAVARENEAGTHASAISGNRRSATEIEEASQRLGQLLHLLLIARVFRFVFDQYLHYGRRRRVHNFGEIGQLR